MVKLEIIRKNSNFSSLLHQISYHIKSNNRYMCTVLKVHLKCLSNPVTKQVNKTNNNWLKMFRSSSMSLKVRLSTKAVPYLNLSVFDLCVLFINLMSYVFLLSIQLRSVILKFSFLINRLKK